MRELTKEELKLVVGGADFGMTGSGGSHSASIQPSFEKPISKDTTIKFSTNIDYNSGKAKPTEYGIGIRHKF